MNIVYIHTHDSGRYWEPYGYRVSTPRLAGLAREGTLFRHCYCAGPTCSASRASLLTGTWPHVNGMIGLAHRGFKLSDMNMHLVRWLSSHGYETALAGVQHEAAAAAEIGYHRLLNDEAQAARQAERQAKRDESHNDATSRKDDATGRKGDPAAERDLFSAESAAQYIKERAGRDGSFFLSFGMFNTHRVFPSDTGDVRQDYVMPPHTLYDCKENREDMAGYLASAAAADRCAGIVLDAIDAAGLAENTIVVCTTDHGIAFPHMKCNLYDAGIGVALMIRYPGNPAAGRATDALVSHIDVFPTLCDICGIEKPDWLAGVSLLDVLEGNREQVNDAIYSEVTYHASYEPMRCIRTQRYKLIRRFDSHLGFVPSNTDNGQSKRFLLDAGILGRPLQREMLFDLYLDPMERENLIGDPAYLTVYNDLSKRLLDWMESTDDPLLRVTYRVPLPEGAIANKLTCLHPEYDDFE